MRFAGYAAIFDAPDRGGDIVRKGAFARAAKGGVPLLWQHDVSRRIGFVESLAEDERGLRVVARLDGDEPVVIAGTGLSFGYRVRGKRHIDEECGTYRELIDLDLIEVSVVTHTHFLIGDDDMQAFDDVLFPLEIGREATVMAAFSTNVVTTLSGHERRNSDWSDARLSYDVGPGVRGEDELGVLLDFFRARRGAAIGFRFTDPFDFSSSAMTGEPTLLDQVIGKGNGLQTEFPLIKTYGADGQVRPVTRPQAGVLVAVNGVASSSWVLAERGIVQFAIAPVAGSTITAGFQFDVPVRFADDRIEVARANFGAGDMPSVPLIEIREAA